jgi:hypothetical protein
MNFKKTASGMSNTSRIWTQTGNLTFESEVSTRAGEETESGWQKLSWLLERNDL